MSWLTNSLKMAGDLLESVDRSAQEKLTEPNGGAGEGGTGGAVSHHGIDGSIAGSAGNGGGAAARYVPRRERLRVQRVTQFGGGGGGGGGGDGTGAGGGAGAGAGVYVGTDAAAKPQRVADDDGWDKPGGSGSGSPPTSEGEKVGMPADNEAAAGVSEPAASTSTSAPALEPSPAHAADSVGSTREGMAKLKADNARLRMEITALNRELDDVDRQMVAAQQRLDAAGDIERALRKQASDAMAEARQARRDADRLARAHGEVSTQTVEKLRRDLDASRKEVERLKAQHEAASTASATSLAALRREARHAEVAAEEASAEAASIRTAAQRREEELAAECQELQTALAQAQRALEQKAGALQSLSTSSSAAEQEADLRREAASAAEAALLAERRRATIARADLQEANRNVTALKVQLEETKRILHTLQTEHATTVAKLNQELAVAKSAAVQDRTAQLEARLRTLAESVVTKQGQLDDLRSENAALQQRLQREQQQRRDAEAMAAEVYGDVLGSGGGSGSGVDVDIEGGGGGQQGGMLRTPTQRGAQQRRTRRRFVGASPAISKLKPIAQNPKVARAIDVVDRFTLRTGWFLSRQPLARLAFLAYFIVLHLWAFFILSFHTHRLDHNSSSGPHTGLPMPTPPPGMG